MLRREQVLRQRGMVRQKEVLFDRTLTTLEGARVQLPRRRPPQRRRQGI